MPDRVSASVTVDCPAELIYRLITDLPRMGEWSPESTGGRWLTGGGPVPGARFLGRNRTGRHSWRTLSKVTAAEQPRRFAFRVTAPVFPVSSWEYRIEPVADGCRVVETWVDLRPGIVKRAGALVTGVSDRLTFNQRSVEQTLARLKTTAEAEVAA